MAVENKIIPSGGEIIPIIHENTPRAVVLPVKILRQVIVVIGCLEHRIINEGVRHLNPPHDIGIGFPQFFQGKGIVLKSSALPKGRFLPSTGLLQRGIPVEEGLYLGLHLAILIIAIDYDA